MEHASRSTEKAYRLPAGVTDMDVVLLAGQSNMSGRGRPLPSFLERIDDRIAQFGSKRRRLEPASALLDMHDDPTGFSPGLVAATQLVVQEPAHRGILLVPAAHGGTGFRSSSTTSPPEGFVQAVDGGGSWQVGHSEPRNLYSAMVEQTNAAIARLEELGVKAHVRAMLWHQGEADVGRLDTEEYREGLLTLVENVRRELGTPALPVIIGGLSLDWARENPGVNVIREALIDLPRWVDNLAYVESQSGRGKPGDTVHLNADGTTLMGSVMAGALRGLELSR